MSDMITLELPERLQENLQEEDRQYLIDQNQKITDFVKNDCIPLTKWNPCAVKRGDGVTVKTGFSPDSLITCHIPVGAHGEVE